MMTRSYNIVSKTSSNLHIVQSAQLNGSDRPEGLAATYAVFYSIFFIALL